MVTPYCKIFTRALPVKDAAQDVREAFATLPDLETNHGVQLMFGTIWKHTAFFFNVFFQLPSA